MIYSEFKEQIISEFKNRYINIDENVGFTIKGINGSKISVANTVEVLLTLEIMFNYSGWIKDSELSCFDFNGIDRYLKNRMINILDLEAESQRITELSYCGIGLLILGEWEEANNIADYLIKNKSEFGGWGRYIADTNPDLYETYLVTKLLHRLNRKIECPKWIKKLGKESSGTKFLYDNTNLNNSNSIEALTILVYMLEYYYDISVDSKYKEYINSYFKRHIEDIKNANEGAFARHPVSDYTIFSFGIASQILTYNKNPFFIEESINVSICKFITDDFMRKPRKSIPFALEYVRLVDTICDRYDPFDEDESVKYEMDIQLKNLEETTIELKNEILLLPFKMSLTIILILLSSIITYFLMKAAILVKIVPEFENYNIVLIVGATIIPFVFSITGIIKKLVNLSSKLYIYFVKRERKKKNERD